MEKETTPFPSGRSGLDSVIYNGHIYVVGEYSETATLDDIEYAPINSDHTVGSWTSSPNHLNIPRSNLGLQVVTNPTGRSYLAAIAGVGLCRLEYRSLQFR